MAPKRVQSPGDRFKIAIHERYDESSAVAPNILNLAAATLDECYSLRDQVEEMGYVIEGSKGQIAANPLLRELRAHRVAFLKLAANLEPSGDAPVSREAAAALARKRWGSR